MLGHAIGEEMALSTDVCRYVEALGTVKPDQIRLIDYGRSWEGRPLWYAVIGSTTNLARADAIASFMRNAPSASHSPTPNSQLPGGMSLGRAGA